MLFFSIALAPALIKVPERVPGDMLEPVAIARVPGPNVSKVAEKASRPAAPANAGSLNLPAEPDSDVVAREADRNDLTGSVQPSAPVADIAVSNSAIKNPVSQPAVRTDQKPKVRKVLRHVARPRAPAYPAWSNAYAQKSVEMPPPNFTNSGY